MRKTFLAAMVIAFAICHSAAAQRGEKLPIPGKDVKMTLVDALWKRHSTRQHSAKPVSDKELGYLLWAASGINRPADGRLTVPSAINAQDIVLYVCRAEGTYRYNVQKHRLERVNDKDLRKACCGRDTSPAEAPIMLLLVSDLDKFGARNPRVRDMALADVGYVSQNICLMCTALDLNTVPRMTMDSETLQKELGLSDRQLPLINHPVSKP